MSPAESTASPHHPHDTPEAAHAAAMAVLEDDQYSQYILQRKVEIAPVLKGLIDAVSQVTVFFNEGRDMVLTCLIGQDNDNVVLDVSPNAALNAKALAADKLFCVAQLDKVRIQFALRGLEATTVDGRPAFRAPLPASLLRLQRREFYRLSLPLTRPLDCTIEFVDRNAQTHRITAHVGDISGGGIGIVALPHDTPIEAGMQAKLVRLDLPETGLINGKLKVCSVAELTNRLGTKSRRAGCEFDNLPGPMQTLVQRYIIKVERERKAREAGLG